MKHGFFYRLLVYVIVYAAFVGTLFLAFINVDNPLVLWSVFGAVSGLALLGIIANEIVVAKKRKQSVDEDHRSSKS
jgi:hypothetical protein